MSLLSDKAPELWQLLELLCIQNKTETDVMDELCCSRSSFFRKKKEALEAIAPVLFGVYGKASPQ